MPVATRIDQAGIEQAVMLLLADTTPIPGGIDDLAVLARGRPQPEVTQMRWARLVRVDVEQLDRKTDSIGTYGEPDRSRVTIVMNVFVRSEQIATNAYELAETLGMVSALLSERRMEIGDLNQVLVTEKATATQDGEADEDREIQSGVVIVGGWAMRK
jgi:hypothetical protein